jgi:GNAT superfamily N-acetyltransferase
MREGTRRMRRKNTTGPPSLLIIENRILLSTKLRIHNKNMLITVRRNPTAALCIMKEAAEWLVKKNMPLWDPMDFENGKFLQSADENNLYTAYVENVPAAAMSLQWIDPIFCPNAKVDSGFIHKLSVSRAFAGKGIAQEFVEWAKTEVRKRNRCYLRLDCAADRHKLCELYEKMGFTRIDRRFVGPYDNAFYECKV